MPVGPVGTFSALALAPAVLCRTALPGDRTDFDPAPGKLDLDLEPGIDEEVVAADFALSQVDAPCFHGTISQGHDQADPSGGLGQRVRGTERHKQEREEQPRATHLRLCAANVGWVEAVGPAVFRGARNPTPWIPDRDTREHLHRAADTVQV